MPIPEDSDNDLTYLNQFFVKEIKINGSTAFSDEVLISMKTAYEGRKVSFEELHDLRHKLSRMYYDKGYVSSGVLLKDQQIKDGIVEFSVVEGKIGSINIKGNERLRDAYINDRFTAYLNEPLSLSEIQASLKMLERDPLIERVNAQLVPGLTYGDSLLKLKVKEKSPYTASIGINNYRSPSIGSERVNVSFGHRNLSGWGDKLYLSGGFTKGLNDYSVSYAIPVNKYDTTFSSNFTRTESVVIEEPFDEIDIKSESTKFGFGVEQPFLRNSKQNLLASLGFETKDNNTSLLGKPFQFSEGAINGESTVNVIGASISYTEFRKKLVFAIKLSARQGLGIFNSTDNPSGPDGKFTTLLGQFQIAARLFKTNSEIIFKSNLQYTRDELLAIERFAVGGSSTVRGYRENSLLRDNGAYASIETRIPVNLSKGNKYRVNLIPFIDYGAAWNKSPSLKPVDVDSIYSIGMGIEINAYKHLNAKVDYAYSLSDLSNQQENNLQDKGIHFSLSYDYF